MLKLIPASFAARTSLAIGAAIGLSASALAADMPVKARPPIAASAFSWTGFYIGAHAGYGRSDTSVELSPGHPNAITFFTLGAVVPSLETRPDGFLGGGQLGYNYQQGPIVYGIEADISYSRVRGSTAITTVTDPNLVVSFTNAAEQKLDWFATLRARLGFTPADSLLYVTGGLAVGRAALSTSLTAAPPSSCASASCPSASTSKTLVG
jgi:outer membrane immunogenic protein